MKNRKLKSITYKLIVAFLIVILSVIILIWVIQAIMLKTSYSWFRSKQIENVVDEIKNDLNIGINKDNIDELSLKNDCTIYIFNDSMESVYVSNENIISNPNGLEKEIYKSIQEVKAGKVNKTFTLSKTQIDYNIYGDKYNENYIIIVSKVAPVEATVKVIENQLKVISIVAIIISVGIAIFISKKIAKPIKETSKKAKELSKGNLEITFNHDEYIEIKELSDTLNKATKELREKDKIKKEVIANVSHDLKTPLSIIQGYCEMLQDITGENKEKRDEQLEKIRKEANNLTLMINDMLDLSKLESKNNLQIEKFEISDLINETIIRLDSIVQNEDIIILYSSKKVIVSGDRNKLGQVLYNLIVNAINFVGEDRTIIINQIESSDYLKIEVKDNGIGIDESELPFIFDRYYKTNDKYRKSGISTGLGLSIVKNILEQHGFDYGVESKKGAGTKFWFKIRKYHIDITK